MLLNGWRKSPGFLVGFRFLAAALALVPFGWLVYRLLTGDLGPDPGQEITEALGLAALQLLIATLWMTPLRHWTQWGGWLRIRRMLGLFAFAYAALHLLAFLQFILGWADLWATFTKRPYIIAGAVAFILLVPLAVTSTKAMMKRLGSRWKPLHRAIYLSATLAWLHFIWQARSDIGEMLAYGAVIAFLLGLRWYWSSWRELLPMNKAKSD